MAEPQVIAEIRRQGGTVYVWPRKLRCCRGINILEAATRPADREFRLEVDGPVRVFVTVGMVLPDSLHLDLDRRSRVRAYWDGLAWIA